MKKAKPKKERPKKYDPPKFSVKGEFADVFKVVKKNKEDNLNKKSGQ